MRIFTYILGIIFTLFSIVQFNDPDAIIWIIIYLIPAIISFLFTHRRISPLVLLILGSAYLIGAIFIFPPSISDWLHTEEKAQSIEMTLPGIEEARESMGLFICFLAMFFYWFRSKKRTK